MKKPLVLILFLIPILAVSQTDTTTYIYGDVMVVGSIGNTVLDPFNVDVYVDLGDGVTYGPDIPIKTSDGKSHIFHSATSALNFLAEDRWSLVSSVYFYYAFKSIYHHYLKRPKFGVKSIFSLPIKSK